MGNFILNLQKGRCKINIPIFFLNDKLFTNKKKFWKNFMKKDPSVKTRFFYYNWKINKNKRGEYNSATWNESFENYMLEIGKTCVQVKKDIKLMSKETGLKPWMIMSLIGLVVVVAAAAAAFCVWRFFRYYFYLCQLSSLLL